MTEPRMNATMRLTALICAAILMWSAMPAPRWAASLETASFRLSLSIDAGSVRLRTGASGTGQSQSGAAFVIRR
ncbi:MAG TPA: hypothetical protein VM900_05100 [Sphingomonas sp.]|jgi:hypothetical protein|nr:hypothetical protein [Sphingomonas sp.]